MKPRLFCLLIIALSSTAFSADPGTEQKDSPSISMSEVIKKISKTLAAEHIRLAEDPSAVAANRKRTVWPEASKMSKTWNSVDFTTKGNRRRTVRYRFNPRQPTLMESRFGKLPSRYQFECNNCAGAFPDGYATIHNEDREKDGPSYLKKQEPAVPSDHPAYFAYCEGFVMTLKSQRPIHPLANRDTSKAEKVSAEIRILDPVEPHKVDMQKSVNTGGSLVRWVRTYQHLKSQVTPLRLERRGEFDTDQEWKVKEKKNDHFWQASFASQRWLWEKMARVRLENIPATIHGKFDLKNKTFIFKLPKFHRIAIPANEHFGPRRLLVSISDNEKPKGNTALKLAVHRDTYEFRVKRTYEDLADAKRAREIKHSVDIEFLMSPNGGFVVVGYAFHAGKE